ncbi:MAG TPA: M17 family metallopeptidase, partial [Steroidobacteraceae bacterium]|nr:M17 family metallopeptidase [Steroidobacteraceae bacterium]
MVQLIPKDRSVRVTQSTSELDGRALQSCDAALVLIDHDRAEQALATLPFPALWRRLYQVARDQGPVSVLASRVPSERLTMVAIGLVKAGTTAFERLALAGRLWREVAPTRPARVLLAAPQLDGAARDAALEALFAAVLAGDAPMPDLRSKPGPSPSVNAIRVLRGQQTLPLDVTRAVDAGNHLARWLTALPPNHLHSAAYRAALRRLARREGWSFRFYDVEALERLGAGAFLAVARANANRAAGIVRLGYRPSSQRRRHVALVGKGICFDTGGINLKPHKSMLQMHEDMQGSAVAVGTLLALTRLKVDHPIDCWLAITENEIGPRAYRPQEVVTAVNGVTIQVVHSDAEGRMALADTLALAAREQPELIVDYATLTGACVNALTDRYSGVFTNRAQLLPALQAVGSASGERVWGFPLDPDFDSDLESRIADVLQC